MSEQTQRPDDEDVQGHAWGRTFGADRQDEPSDDVEGHGIRKPEDTVTGSEDDAEGHGFRLRTQATDGEDADDVEGHVIRWNG